jgi:integrase
LEKDDTEGTKTYKDAHRVRDGKVLVYLREGSPAYQARMSVPGVKGYIFRTTKQKELSAAIQKAEDLFDEVRFRVKNNLDVGTYTFSTLYKKWWDATVSTLSIHRQRFIKGTANRYLLPYFGKKSTAAITDEFVAQYWDWRINYWSSQDGQEKIEKAQKSRTTKNKPYKNVLGNVAKVPAQKTLQMEQSLIRQILYWARRTGRMKMDVLVKAPKIPKSQSVRENNPPRRPAFELEEWRTLIRYLRIWADEESDGTQPRRNGRFGRIKNGGEPVSFVHSLHRYQRQMLRCYVQFMGYSGLRPNEARQLRWRDVDFDWIDEEGKRQVLLYVAPTTKTGEREVIPLWYVRNTLKRLQNISEHTDPDDLVFSSQKGESIENFGKTFKDVLKKCELLDDRFGRARTIYSLRHTYATFRLLYAGIPMETLALNMGTSPKMIFDHYSHVTARQQAHVLGRRGDTKRRQRAE